MAVIALFLMPIRSYSRNDVTLAILLDVNNNFRRVSTKLIILLLCTILGVFLHIAIGSFLWISPSEILKELLIGLQNSETLQNNVVWNLRLPRALGCLLGGGLLGGVGAVFQALFRNPLADPYILGVSSGAAVGGTLAVVLGFSSWFFGLGMMLCAVLFALISLFFVIFLSRRAGVIQTGTLLLAGLVIGLLQSALLVLILIVTGKDVNQILGWLLGSTTPMFWDRIFIMALVLLIGILILYKKTRLLNVFALGEETAQRLGVQAQKLKLVVLFMGTLMTSVAVGALGVLGFVGLVAPHMARLTVGVDLRFSFLASIMMGSILTLFADVLAQRGFGIVELPIGVVTAIIGAPVLIYLLKRREVLT
jgi:iron complex transport system permease protein